MASILNVMETEEVITIAGSEYSIPKLREFFGHDKCWAHVVTSKTGSEALKACNHAGEPGHEVDGALHNCTDQQRMHVHQHAHDFRPEGHRPYKKFRKVGSKSGNGRP